MIELLVVIAIIGILAIETGLLTPPFGILVFTVKAAVTDEKDLTPGEIFSGSIPFWIVLLTTILLIVIFPEIANWLPNLGNELGR
jgi:TRAP-type mannitol/chloroaromatic compound transport system permease large subunit